LVTWPKWLKAKFSKMELNWFLFNRLPSDSMCSYTTFDNISFKYAKYHNRLEIIQKYNPFDRPDISHPPE
jgi:hypothetical protein